MGSCCVTQAALSGTLWQPRGALGVGLRGRECVYAYVYHIVVWQRPAQHCEAIILQLKIY